MKIQIRIMVSVSVLAGSVAIIFLAYFGFRNWYNSSAITDWIVSSEEQDTTERHRQNMEESYQILPDHILLIPDKGEDRHKLVRLNRQGKTEQIVAEEEVDSFLELNQKVYYDVWGYTGWDDEISRIYCYDYETKEHTLLIECPDINWFSVYQDQIIYVCHDSMEGQMQVYSCDLLGKNKKVLYQAKRETEDYYDCQFFLTENQILLLYDIEDTKSANDCQIAMLSLKTKEMRDIITLETWPWKPFLLGQSLFVLQEDALYQIMLEPEKGLADKKRLSGDKDYDEIACLYGKGEDLYSRNYDGEFRLLSERGNP